MSETMECRDIYIQLTDPTGKHKPVINSHRVWNAERFLNHMYAQYDGPETKPEDRRKIGLSTREAYMASRGKR